MKYVEFPVIDPIATGKNILSLRKEKGLTVRDLQKFFGFEEPQAIYRWQYAFCGTQRPLVRWSSGRCAV